MNKQEWDLLSQEEKNLLAAKWGLTRSGENNEIIDESELEKIKPIIKEVKTIEENEKPKKKIRKLGVKKIVKLGNRGRAVSKPKRRKK